MTITNELFTAHDNTIKKICWNHSKSTGLEFDDLYEESLEIFCKAAAAFKPERGTKFNTYLYVTLNRELYNRNDRVLSRQSLNVDLDTFLEVLEAAFPERSEEELLLLDSIATELSTDAQGLLRDLFRGIFQEPIEPKRGRPILYPHDAIRFRYGWTHKRTTEVRKEISEWWAGYRAA